MIADIPNGGKSLSFSPRTITSGLLLTAGTGITNFFSQLITSFGYTSEQSLLYGTPGGAVEIVTLLAGGYLGGKFGNRIAIASFGLILSIIGVAMIVGLPLDNNSGRLGGYYLTQASAMPFVAFLSLISSNVAGYTKKTSK